MKEIIIVSICIIAFLFCLTGIVIAFWTAIAMICEAKEGKKKKPSVNYSAVVNAKLSMEL